MPHVEKALAGAPALTPSQRALERGLAHEARGDFRLAYEEFHAATQIEPECGLAWRYLGNLLRRAGDLGPASACFERAIAAGDDRALNEFYLSALGVGDVVPAAPPRFVQALFDQYAERFDQHLLHDLAYRAHRVLADLVCRGGPAVGSILDLGCGTGLAGACLKNDRNTLVGVDLSPEMLARAAALGVYDRLVVAEMQAHLQASDEVHDLVVCSDALLYTGDLAGIFEGVRRVLSPGGGFGFTIEAGAADAGYDLLPTLRYAHSERYVRRLAQEHGFGVLAIEKDALREQDGQPVDGYVVHLVRLPAMR